MPEHRTTCASLATRPHALEIWSVVGNAEVRDLANARHAKQVRIWVNPDRLTNLGLTVSDLNNAVQQQSAVSPAGQIGGPHQKGSSLRTPCAPPAPIDPLDPHRVVNLLLYRGPGASRDFPSCPDIGSNLGSYRSLADEEFRMIGDPSIVH